MKTIASTWTTKLLVLGISAGVGFAVAIWSFRVQWLVDYDSGARMRVCLIGPFRVRQEVITGGGFGETGGFAFVPADKGTLGLTGTASWHTAAIFWGNSRRSPKFEGSDVVKHILRIESMLQGSDTWEVRRVKNDYLRALSRGGVEEARAFIDRLEVMNRRSNGAARERAHLP